MSRFSPHKRTGRSASSRTRRCASGARRARWRASSGTSCPTTGCRSPACRTTTPCTWARRRGATSRSSSGRWSRTRSSRGCCMSDVCKHCRTAACLDACPTGSIIRTEFDTVFVQPDICNGCGYCVSACPFGVIDRREDDGRAWKCTLCYDRLDAGMTPACAKACPTESIQFGDIDELRARAGDRVRELHQAGVTEAYLYGADAGSSNRAPTGSTRSSCSSTDRRRTTCRPIRWRRGRCSAARGGRWRPRRRPWPLRPLSPWWARR